MGKKLENGELGWSPLNVGDDTDSLSTGGSIAERRGVKFGFNDPKICTPRFRCSSTLPSIDAQSSHYLTIPSGISPTTLLDSPILLANSRHSPTTGTFSSSTLNGDRQISDFATRFDGQSQKSLQQPVNFDFHEEVAVNHHDTASPLVVDVANSLDINASSPMMEQSRTNDVVGLPMKDKNDPSQEEDSRTHNAFIEGNTVKYYSTKTTEDGYNWRKYGQKQVKGSGYPRSYYKCTHPNCHVKKKVVRSHNGQITEIIYKNAHNHSKSQPYQKSTFFHESSDAEDGSGPCVKDEGASVWGNIKPGSEDVNGLEITSSTSVVTEISDRLSTTQAKGIGKNDSVGTPEFSSTLARCEGDEEDAAIDGSFSLGNDNECEPESKRRKKESYFFEPSMGSRAVREPRVVVQIESEVDVLDDGYHWRKYGQKVVKGNPNPRSYYKCTSAGRIVKKHVERASHNLKFVMTTYEGKHNHEVPTARNGNHATNTHSALSLPRHPHVPKPEHFRQDLPSHFDTIMKGNTDLLGPIFVGNSEGGISPYYQMKFPNMPNARPCGQFGLSNHRVAFPNGTSMLSAPFSLGFPHSWNRGRSFSSMQPSFVRPQCGESKVKILRSMQEKEDESLHDTDIENTDTSSSLTHNCVLPISQS